MLRALRSEHVRLHPEQAAAALEARPVEEIAEVLESEPPAAAAAVLAGLSPEMAARAVERLDERAWAAIVPGSDPTRLAPVLARLEAADLERRLAPLESRHARELRELMAYPPDSAGALMDPRVTTFRAATTAEEALARLRTLREREFDEIYLVDDDRRLVGTVALEDLAVATSERRLRELARPIAQFAEALWPMEDVLERLSDGAGSLPVVDAEGRLLGVIRSPELVAAVQEQASADLQTMVGASRDERALSPAVFAVRRRLPWLYVNLATAFLAAAVVGVFEGTIARITALAVLMPVVAGQAGNSGAQALAVAMRGLALREVRVAQWRTLLLKELAVGVLNGVAIAVLCGLGVWVWSRSAGLALVIAAAMVISMTIAGLAGASVPLLLKAIGQDPAQSSSIVLTTVTDVVGFLSFLGLAALAAGALAG